MGIDKSLKTKGKLVRPRNVFSRIERIKMLKGEGKWDPTMSVFGIPKVKALKVKRKAKEKKAAKAEATAEATPTTAGAAGKAEAAAPAAEKEKTKK
ncbi:MAG: small basic protein [Planctomycetota bacterium]|nr:small basic protein [Planctomycetota bacterium]